MNFKRMVSIICILVMSVVFSGCDNSINIAFNAKVGEKYTHHMTIDQDITTTANGKQVKQNQKIDMNYDMEIKGVDQDKSVIIEYAFKHIKMSFQMSGITIETDTNNKDDSNLINNMYSQIIGKKILAKFDSKGNLVYIRGTNEIIKGIINNISLSDEQKQYLQEVLKKTLGEESIQTMFKQSANCYPQKPIKKDDVWESKYENKSMYPVTITNRFKFMGEKNNMIDIQVQSIEPSIQKDSIVEFMGLESKVNSSVTSNGSIQIDKNNAFITKGYITSTSTGSVEFILEDELSQNIKMPINLVQKITFETKKK